MNRLHLSVPVVMCLASLYAAGCGGGEVVVHGPPPPRAEVVVAAPTVQAEVVETVPTEVVVRTKPPAERVEVVPVAPSPAHVWIKGHWHWNGGEWIWTSGRYEIARPGLHWVPAQYIERGGAFYFVAGHWGR